VSLSLINIYTNNNDNRV